MKVCVLGGGWYGCHIARALIERGHDVELHEMKGKIFSGASGANPARLHLGFHYPRTKLTRAFCQEHQKAFLNLYGMFTRNVPINIYAVAASDSFVDFGTYKQILRGELESVEIYDPIEYGLKNIEGALLTGERHIVIKDVREYFERTLGSAVHYDSIPTDTEGFDWVIDCTFCNNELAAVDRYEPCVTVIMSGPTDKAVTVMDGPFPSLYPWDETLGLNSLTSALYTPFSKTCRTWKDASAILVSLTMRDIQERVNLMIEQMSYFWPDFAKHYSYTDYRLSIRAMPRSGADARLVDVVKDGKWLRVRAGKIDAVLHAEQAVLEIMKC